MEEMKQTLWGSWWTWHVWILSFYERKHVLMAKILKKNLTQEDVTAMFYDFQEPVVYLLLDFLHWNAMILSACHLYLYKSCRKFWVVQGQSQVTWWHAYFIDYLGISDCGMSKNDVFRILRVNWTSRGTIGTLPSSTVPWRWIFIFFRCTAKNKDIALKFGTLIGSCQLYNTHSGFLNN